MEMNTVPMDRINEKEEYARVHKYHNNKDQNWPAGHSFMLCIYDLINERYHGCLYRTFSQTHRTFRYFLQMLNEKFSHRKLCVYRRPCWWKLPAWWADPNYMMETISDPQEKILTSKSMIKSGAIHLERDGSLFDKTVNYIEV